MALKIGVIGAGIVGCSVAFHLCDLLNLKTVEIEVISEKFTPDTTSDAAGAIIVPFDVTKDGSGSVEYEAEKLRRWIEEGFHFFYDLYNSKHAGTVDLQLVNGYYCIVPDATMVLASLRDLAIGFREVEAVEKSKMNIPPGFEKVINFSTYIVNPKKLLQWMGERIKAKGGKFIHKKVTNLSDLKGYDIVINCTGLGSYELVGDTTLYPVHGDAAVVSAPWVKQFFLFVNGNDYTYIFPRSNDVLLGGTGRVGDWSSVADEASINDIINKCTQVVPSLSNAKLLSTHAGLRPVRDRIRLEKDSSQSKDPLLVHCYGHGGQGVVLARGCALDVGRIVLDYINEKQLLKSRL